MKKLLSGTLLLALALACPLQTMARVEVGVSISLPPPVVFVEPPQLIVLPGTYVYAVPDAEVDIFFYEGWWWRTWDGRWYRSRDYSSGWGYYENVPSFYREVPSDWRNYYRERRWRGQEWDYRRIPHHQVQRNWRDWQERRYWESESSWGVRGFQQSGRSEAEVNVRIALPPPIVFAAPPEVIVLPGTYVYVVPDLQVDIFFYEGWWWRTWEGRWYRSQDYSSGWGYYRSEPTFYRHIPSDWRNYYRERRWHGNEWNYRRIPHQQVQRNWRDWEKNRYWEKQQSWGVRNFQEKQGRPQVKEAKPKQQPQYRKAAPQSRKVVKPQHQEKQKGHQGKQEKQGKSGKQGNQGKGHDKK